MRHHYHIRTSHNTNGSVLMACDLCEVDQTVATSADVDAFTVNHAHPQISYKATYAMSCNTCGETMEGSFSDLQRFAGRHTHKAPAAIDVTNTSEMFGLPATARDAASILAKEWW